MRFSILIKIVLLEHPKSTHLMLKKSILCKSVLAFTAITLVFAFCSCDKDSKNVKTFQEAAMNLGNTSHTLENEYDYWPNGGIRATGSHLASLISLGTLEKILPCPLYVSGPHHDGQWDLYNDNEFGHYNPKAIEYLANLAEKVVSDDKFVELSKPLVEEYIFTQMYYMMVLHDAFYDEALFDQDGREAIFGEMLDNYGYCEQAYYLINNMYAYDEDFVITNFGIEMIYFWARRWADGTIDQFYQALSTVFMAYYPDYEYATENYWYTGEEWVDGDMFYETEYDCELESEEPICESERIKEKDAIEMIEKAVSNLDNSRNVLLEEFDYWPECGLRITGSHLFSLLSLRALHRILPCELYVSGPHYVNRWELHDPLDYGHYNPEAIKYLNKLASSIVSDKKFVDRTRPLVEKYLKRQMFILKSLYDALNDKDICPDKQAVLDETMGTLGWGYYDGATNEFLANMSGLNDDSFVFDNTGNMFLYWWARRNDDGTMELFHQGLETVYNAYFPE